MAILPFLFLVYTNALLTSQVSAASETFIATRSCSGVRLCADDLPSASIDSDQLLSQLNSSFGSCVVPPGVLCSWECSRDPDCTNFNYRQDPDSCELFHYTPANCSTTVGCTNMEINGTHSCQKPVNASCAHGFRYSSQANSCYRVLYEAVTWNIANRECQRLHHESHLVEIKDEVEQDAIENFLDIELRENEFEANRSCLVSKSSTNGNMIWIGGQTLNLSTCDPFVWKLPCGQTAPMNYTNWSVGSPSCVNTLNEHCVHIWQALNYTWNDIACYKRYCGLCEYDLTY